jgi:hypothetical protein
METNKQTPVLFWTLPIAWLIVHKQDFQKMCLTTPALRQQTATSVASPVTTTNELKTGQSTMPFT